MKERFILFTAPMVRAILEGRKTQTRRTMKPQPTPDPARIENYGGRFGWMPTSNSGKVGIFTPPHYLCPYGEPGDHLWVRETWCNINKPEFKPEYYYRADAHNAEDYDPSEWKWKPSIHMPRWASRILLEIVNVRVERVQDISIGDIDREGTPNINHVPSGASREDFRYLWNSINEKRGFGWDKNPWCWVIEFKVIEVKK